MRSDSELSAPWLTALHAKIIEHANAVTDLQSTLLIVVETLNEAGLALQRASLSVLTKHPSLSGLGYVWSSATGVVTSFERPVAFLESSEHVGSPVDYVMKQREPIFLSWPTIAQDCRFEIVRKFVAEGATSYLALPVRVASGSVHALAFATSRIGGWSAAEAKRIASVVPSIGLMIDLTESRRLLGVIGVAHEIAQRALAEDALRHALALSEENAIKTDLIVQQSEQLTLSAQAADAANRAKSEFLANMSHEIRTPMSAIIGLSDLCLNTDLNAKQRGYVFGVNQAARDLLVIINDILDFSKIDAGKLELEWRQFSLQSSLSQLNSIAGHLAREKGLNFEISVASAVPQFVVGDSLRLGQVLLNLAGNATKFTERGMIGVEVLVHDSVDPPMKSLKLPENLAEDTVVLEFRVRDSGIGIEERKLHDIFSAFSQVDTSNSRRYGGTGLGLAISKELVELMGGHIWVQSTPGIGSCFSFTVQLGRAVANQGLDARGLPVAGDEAVRARLRGARVLVAEDNRFNQQVIEEVLARCGVVVTLCANGQEVLDQLEKDRFDVVLMDIQMPVMDGIETTQRIRAIPQLASLPVIAMTANAMVSDQTRCLEAGMDDFETKPINAERLYQKLGVWLTLDGESSRERMQGKNAFDLSVLGNLLGNDAAKAIRFARMFVQQARSTLVEMHGARAGRDLATLGALGHRQKSAAAVVGAVEFATLCQGLEDASETGDWARAETVLARLPSALDLIAAQIERQAR